MSKRSNRSNKKHGNIRWRSMTKFTRKRKIARKTAYER